jgi:beta-lactamase regulating signal transducer with metallopeptidase domain
MTDLIQHPYTQAFAWALVHFRWQGAAIGPAAVGVVRLTRASASSRYVIGVVALTAMLLMPAVTFTLLALDPAAAPPPHVTSASLALTAGPADPRGPLPAAIARPASAAGFAGSTGRVGPAGPLVAVLLVWALGVMFFSLRLLGGWVVTQRLARRAVRPVAPDILSLARRVAGRLALDRMVRVFESSAVVVPMLVGCFKPAVLLPVAALSGLTPTQLEALLAHELAHVRRHDYLVNMLQSVVETLLFYHPAVWWVSRDVRAAREYCCDDLAVGVCDPLIYATALADLAAMTPKPHLALAATDGSLVARVRRILGGRRSPEVPTVAGLPLLFMALAIGALMPFGMGSTRAEGHARNGPSVDRHTGRDAFAVVHSAAAAASRTSGNPATHDAARATAGGQTANRIGGATGSMGRDAVTALQRATGAAPTRTPEISETSQATGATASEQTASGTGSSTWSHDGETIAIKWTGAFRLSDDDKDIAWVEPGKSVQVSDGRWLLSTGVDIKGLPDGKTEHTYYRHGVTQPYEPEGREFLASMLQTAVHRLGLGASSRVARFLKQGGPNAVLAEIDTLEGDYVRRLYYTELLAQAKLSPADLTRVAAKIGDTIHSDYERATLIVSVAKQASTDDGARITLADAARTITSDYEKRRALSALVADRVSPRVSAAVLRNAAGMHSDYERATLLIDVAGKGGLTGETKQAFFALVTAMQSSFEQSRVLRAVATSSEVPDDVRADVPSASRGVGGDYDRRQVLSAALRRDSTLTGKSAQGVLEAASSMQSDNERAAVLLEVLQKGGLTADTSDQFFAAVMPMRSSYEQRRVLAAVSAQAVVPEGIAIGLLKAAATIRGDNDRAEVLIDFARRHAVSAAARPFYLTAADGIRSEWDQTRALAELVRSERRAK